MGTGWADPQLGMVPVGPHSSPCPGAASCVTLSFLTVAPGQAKTKGMQSGVDIGVKYSEKQQRNFDEAKMKAGQCVIGLQVGWLPSS